MIEMNAVVSDISPGALTAALQSTLGKVTGISTYGTTRPISVWLTDDTTQNEQNSLLPIIANHDPVFISSDKIQITANDTDTVTISVLAPKASAAPVTLSVSINGGVAIDAPVVLTGGIGTVQFTSKDPATISISVKNGANRSTQVLTIKAV